MRIKVWGKCGGVAEVWGKGRKGWKGAGGSCEWQRWLRQQAVWDTGDPDAHQGVAQVLGEGEGVLVAGEGRGLASGGNDYVRQTWLNKLVGYASLPPSALS